MTTIEKDRITNAIKPESNRIGFISCEIKRNIEFLKKV
jgi:hypothetical protein